MATPAVNTELPAATELALDRTRLAHERTLMAWIRTATIGTGWSITFRRCT